MFAYVQYDDTTMKFVSFHIKHEVDEIVQNLKFSILEK